MAFPLPSFLGPSYETARDNNRVAPIVFCPLVAGCVICPVAKPFLNRYQMYV